VRDHEKPQDIGEGPWNNALFFRPTDGDAEGEDYKDDAGDEGEAVDAMAPEELDDDDGDYEAN